MKRQSKVSAAKYMFYTSLVGFISSIVNKLLDFFLQTSPVQEAAKFAAEGTAIETLELAAGGPINVPWKWVLIGGTLILTISFKKLWKKLRV